MAPRLPSVSSASASASLSWKNSRESAVQVEMISTDGRDESTQQKVKQQLPPPKNEPKRIPLTSSNRFPSQVLNIISSSADPSLTIIDLDKNPLGDSEVSRLTRALTNNTTVKTLSLRKCNISDRAVKSLAECLQRNTTLTALHLDANRISQEGCAILSTALIKNETLSVLTLNQNQDLGDKGVAYLMNALEHNTSLLTLEVKQCGVHEKRMNRLEAILADRQLDSHFESLLLRLKDDDFRVSGIDMSGRQIGDKGAIRLADALTDNTQVRQLWLRSCQIGDKGAKALASCFEQNMAIVDLYLANNNIGDEGLSAIADALGLSNLTLVTLELNGNRVGERGIESLIRAMERNTSVLQASFENNPMLRDSVRFNKLKKILQERRNGLNKVSFVVDPENDADDKAENENKGIVDLSVCSSYLPSTYRRAGFNSITDTKKRHDDPPPRVPAPPSTPNRNRRDPSLPPRASEIAKNVVDKPPKTSDQVLVSIQEGSHETSPGTGPSPSRSIKKNGNNIAVVEREKNTKASDTRKSLHSIGRAVAANTGVMISNPPDPALSDPKTQRNFDDTIKTLFRRIETLLRVNHHASDHYRARHYWFCFIPMSSCIFLAAVLSFVNAFNISGAARLGVGLSACVFALLAFLIGFLQSRLGLNSRADIHSSAIVELSQVAFRLENLRVYQNGKLLSASTSQESRAHAIRDLYRIDVYLQAMQQCTPDPPDSISEAFHLMSSRMRLMWLRYPHVVKHRFAEYGEEPVDALSPVPVEMHMDALDLLGNEIEDHPFYPIFLPDPVMVVSRSIDIFFSPDAQSIAPSYTTDERSNDDEGPDYL